MRADVRAAIHTPSRALRLARLPVEFAACDLLDRELVRKAVKNCDIIVNCAKGRINQHNTPKKVMEIDVEGARNILEAAQEEKVKKIIHISSAAVYGFSNNDRRIDEAFPFKSKRNRYVKEKIESENVVTSYSKRIPAVILRPTLIYGPYSEDWAVDVLKRIKEHKVSLSRKDGMANLVYVDDVVDAILLSMMQDSANGKAFIVNNDEERVTWSDYVSAFSNMAGIPPIALDENFYIFKLKKEAALVLDSLNATSDLLKSSDLLLLLSRVPLALVLGNKLLKGSKRKMIETRLSSVREFARPQANALSKYETPSHDLYELFECKSVFSSDLAKKTIGFKPNTAFEVGIRNTLDWIKWTWPAAS